MEAEWLASRLEEGRSIESIAREALGLRRHDLRTRPARYSLRDEPKPEAVLRECALHGWTTFVRIGAARYRCGRCNGEAVSERRRQVKAILVREAGGSCVLCGYGRYAGALQFHHVDPTAKSFGVSARGLARSLARARAEVAKCVLLCANCHAEVEGGVATIPISRPVPATTGPR